MDDIKTIRMHITELKLRNQLMSGDLEAALTRAMSALEKQIAMEPEYVSKENGLFECPNCKEMIYGVNIKNHRYCLNCGQKIDWKEM